MDTGCKFKDAAGCTECDHVRFLECTIFRRHLIFACGASLRPFKLHRLGGAKAKLLGAPVVYGHYPIQGKNTVLSLQSNSVYQQLGNTLKSVAVSRALRDFGGLPVQYHGVDSIVNTCYSYNKGEYQFARGVYFLELVDSGGRGVCQVFVDSFISLALAAGGVVCLLSAWFLPSVGVDWVRVTAGGKSTARKGATYSEDF